MRAHEFTINIPINIKINGDGEPEITTGSVADDDELQSNPVMVSPLQQQLELAKADQGKASPIIDKITQDNDLGTEDDQEQDSDYNKLLTTFKQVINRPQ
jgi:hypothetical protein